MFCPQCGTNQSDDLKFCKSCGANLYAVRQVVATRETSGKIDWSKTWVAEMFLSQAERKRREEELERQLGVTPDVKRYREIKAGIITAFVGVGVTIFLYVLMDGIIRGGQVGPGDAEILSRIWVAGVIPFFVGVGLIVAGLLAKAPKPLQGRQDELSRAPQQHQLGSADASEFFPSSISVTENTTKHLAGPEKSAHE